MRSLPSTDCERGVARQIAGGRSTLESIPRQAAPTDPYPPFPLSDSLIRQFRVKRTHGVRYLVLDASCESGRCQPQPRDTKHRGTLRCDEGRRERSPDPSTRQRLGMFTTLSIRFFPADKSCGRSQGLNWQRSAALGRAVERGRSSVRFDRPRTPAPPPRTPQWTLAPVRVATSSTDSNSGIARSVPSGRTAAFTRTTPNFVWTSKMRLGNSMRRSSRTRTPSVEVSRRTASASRRASAGSHTTTSHSPLRPFFMVTGATIASSAPSASRRWSAAGHELGIVVVDRGLEHGHGALGASAGAGGSCQPLAEQQPQDVRVARRTRGVPAPVPDALER